MKRSRRVQKRSKSRRPRKTPRSFKQSQQNKVIKSNKKFLKASKSIVNSHKYQEMKKEHAKKLRTLNPLNKAFYTAKREEDIKTLLRIYSPDKETLHYALNNNRYIYSDDLYNQLFEKGALPSPTDFSTAIKHSKSIAILEQILKHGGRPDTNTLSYSLYNTDYSEKLPLWLIEHGSPINENTLTSAMRRSPDIIQKVIKLGAVPDSLSLKDAIWYKQPTEIIEQLLHMGARLSTSQGDMINRLINKKFPVSLTRLILSYHPSVSSSPPITSQYLYEREYPELIIRPPTGNLFNIKSMNLSRLALTSLEDLTAESVTRETKIQQAFDLFKKQRLLQSYVDVKPYDQVFITSDLHSDFLKLVQILFESQMIRLPNGITIEDLFETHSHDNYLRVVVESVWIASKTLFLIIGDLVDGARPVPRPFNIQRSHIVGEPIPIEYDTYNVYGDVDGDFELLLHCLLYNLRLQAIERGSLILFTIGNHDHHTVILNDNTLSSDPNNYITSISLLYFGSIEQRQKALFPFYDLSPYYVLELHNNKRTLAWCVHAGLHYIENREEGEKMIRFKDQWHDLQSFYFKTRFSQDQIVRDNPLVRSINSGGESSPIWTQLYAKKPMNMVCNAIYSLPDQPMMIVGHCSTSNNYSDGCLEELKQIEIQRLTAELKKHNTEELREQLKSFRRSPGVILGCSHSLKGSRLAFVDSAISSAFNPDPIGRYEYQQGLEARSIYSRPKPIMEFQREDADAGISQMYRPVQILRLKGSNLEDIKQLTIRPSTS